MLTFLMPAALAALGLLAVPVIIHLLRPRKVRVIPFSSLRWLRASQHRLTRRIQWHQFLLFLLRAGFLAALALAMAKPVVSLLSQSGPADRALIVEAGPAMDYRAADRARPADLIRPAAQALLLQSSAGGRTVLLAAGGETELPPAVSADSAPLADSLRLLRPAAVDARVTDPLPFVTALLGARRPGAPLDLYFFTANLGAGWSRGEIVRFLEDAAPPVRVHVVDAGPERPQNAWIRSARLVATERPLRRAVVVSVASAGDAVKDRTLRLAGVPGLTDLARPVALAAGRPQEVEFELPAGLELAGKTAVLTLDPSDELPSDDRWWLPLDPRAALSVLVLEPDSTTVAELQSGFHLRKALEALSDDKAGLLRVTRRSDLSAAPADVAAADVVFMADLPRLRDETLAALQKRVQEGGGLAVFLGPSIDLAFYRTRLFDPLRPSGSLLPAPPGEPVNLRGAGKLARLAALQWAHPLLAGLFDPTYGDLMQAAAGIGYALPLPPASPDTVLAAWEGIGPAVVERRLGAGRILLFNSTANDAWSDLPRRKSFVPLVDRTLDALAGGLRRGMVEAGRPLSLILPVPDNGTAVTVTGPRGACSVTLRSAAGRVVAETDQTREPGLYTFHYRAGGADVRVPLVVQASRRASALQRMDPEVLRAWWQPASCEIIKPGELLRRLEAGGGQVGLDPWLMLLALLLFAAEMIVVNRLCPRTAPGVVSQSAIAERGFFKPGGEGSP